MQHWSPDNPRSVDLPSINELSGRNSPPGNSVLSVAPIDFAKMIVATGAHRAVDAMADHFGLAGSEMRDIIAGSGPFFLRAHRQWMERPGGHTELSRLERSGGPQQFADRPELVRASVSRQEGRIFLEYLFLDAAVVDMVTRRIAERLDLHPQKLEKVMPNLAALFVGVICKSMSQ